MTPRLASFLILVAALCPPASCQTKMGRLVVQVEDETGAAISAVEVALQSAQTHVSQVIRTDASGAALFRGLPFGTYALRVDDVRFDPVDQEAHVSSEVSRTIRLTLKVRRLVQQVAVPGLPPQIDPQKTSSSLYLGQEQIRRRPAGVPNRDAINMVASLPGWVLEGNGVLHPRGSEYQTQYVVDGIPIFDNRSSAFAAGPLLDGTDSMEVITGGIPAEFGRKLGGVVNVASRTGGNDSRGEVQLHGGGQSILGGGIRLSGGSDKLGYSGVLSASRTSRYLDPPAAENFHNRAELLSGFLRLDYVSNEANALRLFAWANGTGLQVPNEPFQQRAGQHQVRRNRDSNLSLGWEHYASSQARSSIVAYARQVSSKLNSNLLSTPVISEQDRNYQAYGLLGSFSWIAGNHQLKLGGDILLSPVRERFSLAVTNPAFFENDGEEEPILQFTAAKPFRFFDRHNSLESSFFFQDRWTWNNLTVQMGIRFDQYRFLVRDTAWSPRLGLGYFIARTQTRFHFAYDRAFQTPTTENLLLSSANAARTLSGREPRGTAGGLPVPTSRAHFFEAGFSQAAGKHLRIDGQAFRRSLRNFEDDDVFFNTGIGFPISLDRAVIRGAEARLELQELRGVSGFASYSNLSGVAFSPITGGLFAGEEAFELLQPGLRLPITQDQRNTVHAQVQYQPKSSLWWTALGFHYESGLPVELSDDAGPESLEDDFSELLLSRVNLARGRVRPRHLWDVTAGIRLWKEEQRSATLQLDVINLTNRLYLINFNGLFSGTAVGLPRTVSAKLSFEF